MKRDILLLLPFFITACSSTIPSQVHTQPPFYNLPTANTPNPQCVYKSAVTETEKAQAKEQGKNLRKAIYQNWALPKNVNEDKTIRASFEISSSCEIINIQVYADDTALKQSIITALQNTSIAGVDFKEFEKINMGFKVK